MERALIKEFAHPDTVDDELRVHSLICKARLRHVDGVDAETEMNRLTGEPFTSLMNGGFNLLHSFIAAKIGGHAWNDETVEWIMVEGDDKLDGLNDSESLMKAAQLLGLKIKFITDGPLTNHDFLGRHHIWDGTKIVSVCDFWRTMKKFHLSARPTGVCTPRQLLKAKCLSYLATDSRTPIIGALAWSLLQQVKDEDATKALEVFKARMQLSPIGVKDLCNLGPPRLRHELIAGFSAVTGLSIPVIIGTHECYLKGIYVQMTDPELSLLDRYAPV
jgi:hypothetical protein